MWFKYCDVNCRSTSIWITLIWLGSLNENETFSKYSTTYIWLKHNWLNIPYRNNLAEKWKETHTYKSLRGHHNLKCFQDVHMRYPASIWLTGNPLLPNKYLIDGWLKLYCKLGRHMFWNPYAKSDVLWMCKSYYKVKDKEHQLLEVVSVPVLNCLSITCMMCIYNV